MLSAFADVKPYVKVSSTNKVRFDTTVNKLHYRATVVFLMLCCILVVINDYIGKTIECISKGGAANNAVTTYCWISSTYTLPSELDKETGVGVAQPGVGPGQPNENKVYHAYYQWVPFMLLFQAILFYIPHFIWKFMENSMLRKLLDNLTGERIEGRQKNPNDDEQEEDEDFEEPSKGDDDKLGLMPKKFKPTTEAGKKILLVAQYMKSTMNQHVTLYAKFVLCELLCFIVVIVNIVLTDTFLGGAFSKYGTEVLTFINTDDEFRTDPMTKIFPRITKCNWHSYGPSGSIQTHDVLCVLAINIINEKIYVFLWFWFILLAVLTGVQLVRRVIEMVSSAYRMRGLRRAKNSKNEKKYLDALEKQLNVGDWFILNAAKQTMLPDYYKKLLRALHEELEGIELENIPRSSSNPMYPTLKSMRKRFAGTKEQSEGYHV